MMGHGLNGEAVTTCLLITDNVFNLIGYFTILQADVGTHVKYHPREVPPS